MCPGVTHRDPLGVLGADALRFRLALICGSIDGGRGGVSATREGGPSARARARPGGERESGRVAIFHFRRTAATAPSSRRVSSRKDGCDRADLDGAVVGRTVVRSARANPPVGARARVATGGVKSETAEKHPPPPRFRWDLSEGTARSRARTERMLLLESGARGHLGREEPLAACAESFKGRTCVGVPCALERMLAPRSQRACVFSREARFPGKNCPNRIPFAVSKRSPGSRRQHQTLGQKDVARC